MYNLLKDNFFGEIENGDKLIEDYKIKCHQIWTVSNVFQTKEELASDISSCIEQLEQSQSLSKLINNKYDANAAATTSSTTSSSVNAAANTSEVSTLASKLESIKLNSSSSNTNEDTSNITNQE